MYKRQALRRWVGAAPLLLPEEAARKAFAARAPQWKGREAARAWTAFSLARERMEVNGCLLYTSCGSEPGGWPADMFKRKTPQCGVLTILLSLIHI